MSISFRLEWIRDIHQRTSPNTIAVTDFGIIISERSSRLVHISKETGKTIWKTRIVDPWGRLAVTDTYVTFLQYNFLQCFNLESGTTLWQRSVDRLGTYLVAKDRYLIAKGWRECNIVTCMDITSGRSLWFNLNKHDHAPIIMSPWGVILTLKATHHQLKSLQLLDYEQGKIEFEVDIPAKVSVTYSHAGIQLAGNTLYATTPDGEIYALDLKQQRWTLQAFHPQGIRTITPSYINDSMLFLDKDKHLCCYDLKNGQMKWRQALDHKAEFLPVTHYENIFIIGTSEGHLIAVDDLGNRIWARTVGKQIGTPLFMADGGQLILGTRGAIVSYRLVTLTDADTPSKTS